MPLDPSNRRATRALIAYRNPPFQNSRSATGKMHANCLAQQLLECGSATFHGVYRASVSCGNRFKYLFASHRMVTT